MSTVMMRRVLGRIRTHDRLRIGVIALIVLLLVAISAVLEGDLPEFWRIGLRGMRDFLGHYSYLPGFALLYIEESGIPLPAPGDVFVMYVGIHVPHNILAFIAAWLGLIAAVVLGATNLFFISRKVGDRLIESRFAEYIHLSPERMKRAEAWFQRYGVLAIIFGRHIPGFRVPITVAAGVLRVPYRVFAPSVAVSTAIWAGVMLIIGVNYGPRLALLLKAHSQIYFVWAAIVVVMIAAIYVRGRLQHSRTATASKPAGR